MRFVKFIVVFTACFMVANRLYAQISCDFGTTEKTSHNPKNRHKHKEHSSKRLIHWIKNDSKGLLLGNACMDKVTYSMGFEYVVQIKGQQGNRHEFGRLINNLGAKTAIFFRNGPFWKFKLRRKRKECRRLTGDHLG